MFAHIKTLNVQRLFALAAFLKLGMAVLGYILNQPIWLGMVAPLAVMIAYMVLGYYKRDSDVSADKFADSCYYLGFLFTIASIVMCLFDVPKMGTGAGLYEIAVRFGAAMISTLLGLAVRVYLVSFAKDAGDAVKDVEQALVDASRIFTIQLQDTIQNLRALESQIVDATKASVASVQVQIEAQARQYAQSLTDFYTQMTEEHRQGMQTALGEVQDATVRMTTPLNRFATELNSQLETVSTQVENFTQAMSSRLQSLSFPDDFIAKQLEEPLNLLKLDAQTLGAGVRNVASKVEDSAVELSNVLEAIQGKTQKVDSTVEALIRMSEQHRLAQNQSDHQTELLKQLVNRLAEMQTTFQNSNDTMKQLQAAAQESTAQFSKLVTEHQNQQELLNRAVEAFSISSQNSEVQSRQMTSCAESLQTAAQEVTSHFQKSTLQFQALTDSLRKRDEYLATRPEAMGVNLNEPMIASRSDADSRIVGTQNTF